MKPKLFEQFDYILFLSMLLLVGLGIAFIYSSCFNAEGVRVSNLFIKQLIWFAVGLIVLFLFALYDYRKSIRYVPVLFAVMIAVLILTLFIGKGPSKYIKSWIYIGSVGFQPSEFSKLIFVFFLAWYFEHSKSQNARTRFVISLAILAVPVLLILKQPDLGTASVFFPIYIFMCFMAEIPMRYIMLIVCGTFSTIILAVLPVWQTEILHKSIPIISILSNTKLSIIVIATTLFITIISLIGYILFKKKYYYWMTYVFGIFTFALVASIVAGKRLDEYQWNRLIVFLDPSIDIQDKGWQIYNSKTAIGSGNFLGRGFLHGPTSHGKFLSEQSTDFIFGILAEEMGFVGGLIVFILFLVMFIRIIYIIKQTTNFYGYLICSGILGMFFYHFIINIGMVMGIMPIIGIPLPFLSYGGSSLVMNMATIGIILSINSRKLDFSLAV